MGGRSKYGPVESAEDKAALKAMRKVLKGIMRDERPGVMKERKRKPGSAAALKALGPMHGPQRKRGPKPGNAKLGFKLPGSDRSGQRKKGADISKLGSGHIPASTLSAIRESAKSFDTMMGMLKKLQTNPNAKISPPSPRKRGRPKGSKNNK